jgi:hypothetical protein
LTKNSRFAEEIAQEQVAKKNPELARAVADIIRNMLVDDAAGMGMKLNTGKDLPSAGVQQQDEKGFSFPLYPQEFAQAKNIGYIQVNGQYSEPLHGHGPENKGKNISVNMEVCYYFKKPMVPGGGKCMFNTPAGVIDLTFDDQGNPKIEDSGQIVDLADAIEHLRDRIVDDPPKGSESTAVDPNEERVKSEQADLARRFKKQEEKVTGDKETHGSIEQFVQYLEDNEETTYGQGDLQKLLNNMYKNPQDRAFHKTNVMKELEQWGLKFDPKKTHVSSGPEDVAEQLRFIAAKLERSESPQKRRVLRDLREVLFSLE